MTRLAPAALLALVALIAPGVAQAQGACPDGRTASGNASIRSLRKTGVWTEKFAFLQPAPSGRPLPVLDAKRR
ncbi:MAG: hypothetical protein K2Y27_13710 [Xanthobacteraceae bacterium]|nr:hypothetical protein [Xanthobacteraceae bacterium]